MSALNGKANMNEIRNAAIALLARREHSFSELTDKLCRRFDDKELIEIEVQKLADDDLQNDRRYAEAFVRYAISKCHGPVRIRNDLLQKGISNFLIDASINEASPDWLDLLHQLSVKKYGGERVSDIKDKAKRYRFFTSKGFTFDCINSVLQ